MIEEVLKQTEWLEDFQQSEDGHCFAKVANEKFVEMAPVLKEEYQFLILFNHYVQNLQPETPTLRLDLYNPLEEVFLTLEVVCQADKPFLELKDTWKNLALFEHEARDLKGIIYKRVNDPVRFFTGVDSKGNCFTTERVLPHRPLNDLGKFPREIRKYECNNAQLWSCQLLLDMDIETIYQSIYFYGIHHRALETSMIGMSLEQLRNTLITINPSATLSYDLGLMWGIEKKLGIKIPNRALAIRMLFIELERMVSHIAVLKAWASEVDDNKSYGLLTTIYRQLKDLLQFNLALGLRFCPGGVSSELDRSWIERAFRLFKKIEPEFEKIETRIRQDSRLKSLSQFSKVNLKDCIDWGASGPVVRASGVRLDWRTMDDFGLYKEVEFCPILLKDGTTQDRLLLRILEVEQSRNILVQLLENLPLNQSLTMGFNNQKIDITNLTVKNTFESPEGLIKFQVCFDEKSLVKFAKIVGPSYSNTQLMNEKLKGIQLRDLELVMLGFNPCNTEIDR